MAIRTRHQPVAPGRPILYLIRFWNWKFLFLFCGKIYGPSFVTPKRIRRLASVIDVIQQPLAIWRPNRNNAIFDDPFGFRVLRFCSEDVIIEWFRVREILVLIKGQRLTIG